MFKDKNTILNEVKKFWEKEFYRLIDPYRDVLDNSSVETLKARMKYLLEKMEEKKFEIKMMIPKKRIKEIK